MSEVPRKRMNKALGSLIVPITPYIHRNLDFLEFKRPICKLNNQMFSDSPGSAWNTISSAEVFGIGDKDHKISVKKLNKIG